MAKKAQYVVVTQYNEVLGPHSSKRAALDEAEMFLDESLFDFSEPPTAKDLTACVSVVDISTAPALDLTKIAEKLLKQEAKRRKEDEKINKQYEATIKEQEINQLFHLADMHGYVLTKED